MQWNYTTVLNLLFLVIAAVLVIRFLRTGGPAMLKMMSMPADAMSHHDGHTHLSHDHDSHQDGMFEQEHSTYTHGSE